MTEADPLNRCDCWDFFSPTSSGRGGRFGLADRTGSVWVSITVGIRFGFRAFRKGNGEIRGPLTGDIGGTREDFGIGCEGASGPGSEVGGEATGGLTSVEDSE